MVRSRGPARLALAAVVAPVLLAVGAGSLAGCTSAAGHADKIVGQPGAAIGATSPAGRSSAAASAAAKRTAAKLSAALSVAASSAATKAASAAATAAKARAASRPATAATSAKPAAAAPAPVARPSSAVPPAPSVTYEPGLEAAVFDRLNSERTGQGLPPLERSAALDTSSRRHSVTMASYNYLSHQLPGEAGVPEREAAAGYPVAAWAENVGQTPQGDESGALALEDLLFSDPPHRLNILNKNMRAVGVGIVVDSHGMLWLTEDFGG